MAYEVRAFGHFGDYEKNPAFAAFHELSVRAFSRFHENAARADARPLTDLIRRMIYVAEASSVALRLDASWALTHPAFSLCRDRFEQCVRFSWLVRQTDNREWHNYINDLYVRRDRLKRAFAASGIDVPELDNPAIQSASDEKIKPFPQWEKLSLDQLAERRDKLDGITNSSLDRQTLRTFYDSIYRQGSSVSHYDLYSIQMLGLYKGPAGLVLAPDPALPIVTVLHCALFDLIQCAEALAKLETPAPPEEWNAADEAWWTCVKQTGIMDIGGSG